MKLQEISIERIVPYENNAKMHGEEQLKMIKRSIQEFGFVNPCLIDENFNLIAGHGRVEAARMLGMKKVPCVFVEGLTDEQRKAYILADNRISEFGEWDMSIVNDELIMLDDMDFDVSITGFTIDDDYEEKEIIDDKFEDNVPQETITKRGQIYQLGNHRVMCGDSTDINDIKELLEGVEVEMSFTSPPYNVGDNRDISAGTKDGHGKYLEKDINPDYLEFLNVTTQNQIDVSKYTFINLQMLSNNKRDIVEWIHGFRDLMNDIAIWDKGWTTPAIADNVMNSSFEFIFIFSKYNNSRTIGTRRFRGDVQNIYRGNGAHSNEFSDIHAATFPIHFPSHFIQTFTNEGESVLDVFGGTGTTIIACEQLNRKCYSMEVDPRYVDVIIKRWEDFTGEKAKLVK